MIVDSSSSAINENRDDSRTKVSLKIKSGHPFSLGGMLAPLLSGGGVVFPYTPTVQVGHTANYGTYDITHTQYQPNYYVSTQSPSINLTANFTANDLEEAAHTAAAIQFFKACTKGDFGEQRRSTAGTPPPILSLRTYGNNSLHAQNTPVIIRSFNYTLPEDVNYVEGEFGTLPTMMLISLDLSVQFAPSETRKEFNIEEFAQGKGGRFI